MERHQAALANAAGGAGPPRLLTPEAAQRAAEAFARCLLAPEHAADAARSAVEKARPVSDVRAVRTTIRTIVLQRLPRPAARGIARVRPPAGMTCTDALEVMIARGESGTTQPDPRLSRHLAGCESCAGIAARLRAADRAFAQELDGALAVASPTPERWSTAPPPAPTPAADRAAAPEAWRPAALVPATPEAPAAPSGGSWAIAATAPAGAPAPAVAAAAPDRWQPAAIAASAAPIAPARRRRGRGTWLPALVAVAVALAVAAVLVLPSAVDRSADRSTARRPPAASASATAIETPLSRHRPVAGGG